MVFLEGGLEKESEIMPPVKSVPVSKDLLHVGKTTDNPLVVTKNKQSPSKQPPAPPPQICRLPPSSVLQRVRGFLPQMAEAQVELERRLEEQGEEEFDIENTDGCDRVIQMTLSLVDQDSDAEEEDSDASDVEDKMAAALLPVTEDNLKLPSSTINNKPRIEVMEQEESNQSDSSHSSSNASLG